MMLGRRFDLALTYASELHRSQLRKGTNIPYVSHLLAVAALVIENDGDEDQAIAALLHDAAEDQGGASTLDEIRERFGESVAAIVADCTDAWTTPKPAWRDRKIKYLESLRTKPRESLLVSLADKVHNARCIVADRQSAGEKIWERFTEGHDGTRWYYRELSDFFEAKMPSALSRELKRLVDLMS